MQGSVQVGQISRDSGDYVPHGTPPKIFGIFPLIPVFLKIYLSKSIPELSVEFKKYNDMITNYLTFSCVVSEKLYSNKKYQDE